MGHHSSSIVELFPIILGSSHGKYFVFEKHPAPLDFFSEYKIRFLGRILK